VVTTLFALNIFGVIIHENVILRIYVELLLEYTIMEETIMTQIKHRINLNDRNGETAQMKVLNESNCVALVCLLKHQRTIP
jgi:hypothetical protein